MNFFRSAGNWRGSRVLRQELTAGAFGIKPGRAVISSSSARTREIFKRVDREVNDLPFDLPGVINIGLETGIHFKSPAWICDNQTPVEAEVKSEVKSEHTRDNLSVTPGVPQTKVSFGFPA
jgi:hypothetical protein